MLPEDISFRKYTSANQSSRCVVLDDRRVLACREKEGPITQTIKDQSRINLGPLLPLALTLPFRSRATKRQGAPKPSFMVSQLWNLTFTCSQKQTPSRGIRRISEARSSVNSTSSYQEYDCLMQSLQEI
jgi:hypothetical protein